jgi:hypothetical protein
VRFAFSVLGCAAILYIGFATRGSLTFAVGFLLLLTVPAEWNRTLVRITSGSGVGDGMSEEEAGRLIFRVLKAPRFEKWTASRRNSVAAALLPEFVGRRASLREAAAGFVIYLICLIIPVLFFVRLY